MPNKPEFIEFLLDWLSPLGQLDTRRMFSGNAIYERGRVFALVARDTLYLKVDEVTKPRFEALGLKAFQPFPDKPGTMSYCQPPAEFFEDRDVMLDWGRAAIAASVRAAAKPAKKRPRKPQA